MDGTSASPQRLNAAQRSAHIREVVLAKGVELRRRYPILNHQDALGVGILAFALAGMIGSATLYITGHMAWWVCLWLNAFFASLTHELEHDLIHSMYFRKQRGPHALMMGLVWLARPSTINPWIRRHLHLTHHKVSGTETDMEVMREMGVRFNDFGTFGRANRFVRKERQTIESVRSAQA
ncbi:hypothetical protein PS833_04861 [Pseudomonas fluorescens]|uniref:Fatty acid desaturase domain-containing protein n=1 Tax=Pseudomonas fluorescens TaxID=294 RepID=A0A5E7EQV7_PSEFL|nr:hypothetical protein PS833_04861 [Pseudomonas fluorescens]